MKVRLRQIGNSRGIIIPRSYLIDCGMDEDVYVIINNTMGVIRITRLENDENEEVENVCSK